MLNFSGCDLYKSQVWEESTLAQRCCAVLDAAQKLARIVDFWANDSKRLPSHSPEMSRYRAKPHTNWPSSLPSD